MYCSTGEMHDPDKRAEELQAIRAMGYRCAKLRVKSVELKDDIRQIEVVRKHGDDFMLGVDANPWAGLSRS